MSAYSAPCSISALRFVRSKCTYLYVVSIFRWTQESLAEAVGYENHTIIAKIESGLSLPSLDKAFAISEVLAVSLDSLLREEQRGGLEFAQVQKLLKRMPPSLRGSWVAFLRALADDLEQQAGSP